MGKKRKEVNEMNNFLIVVILICTLIFSGCGNTNQTPEFAEIIVSGFLNQIHSKNEKKYLDFQKYLGVHSENDYIVGVRLFCSKEDQETNKQIKNPETSYEVLVKLQLSNDCISRINSEMESGSTQFFYEYLRKKINLDVGSDLDFDIKSTEKIAYEGQAKYYIVKTQSNDIVFDFYIYEEERLRKTFGDIWRLDINGKLFPQYVYSH